MVERMTSPGSFFGFELGSDRQLARWDQIVSYFELLASQTQRMRVNEMGKTVEGNPFILVIISSEKNIEQLAHWREVNSKISDPRGVDKEALDDLVASGKAVICQSMSLHANEVGGTQMAPELAYDLVTGEDGPTRLIRDNVIFLMVPCFNPDGQIMVTDWYDEHLDSEYEGSMLPWLYHRYAGHDNNRDAFMQNLPESQYMARLLFSEWTPQAYQDHHHMGGYGARFYVAPYCEPIHPHADPLVWREHAWFGSHMATLLEQAGKRGVLNAAQFEGWGHLGFHWLTAYHNIAGMLTESASCKLATPLYIHPEQLEGACDRTMPAYTEQTNFPHPWPGGWWRLRDIVEQQKISAWALLDFAARHRHDVLKNARIKAERQIQRGRTDAPYAYAIAKEQHDPLTVLKLLDVLLGQGFELHQAQEEFTAGRTYPQGTYVLFTAQPKRGAIMTLLGTTYHPDNQWTRDSEGYPQVRDMATDTVAEFMGVEVDELRDPVQGEFARIEEVKRPPAYVPASSHGYLLDVGCNDNYRLVNLVLEQGLEVFRTTEPCWVEGRHHQAGSFYVPPSPQLERIKDSLPFRALWTVMSTPLEAPVSEIKKARTGMYQRYWGGNMDEGWTRLVLEQFSFPFQTVRDAPFKEGRLLEEMDVLILPSDSMAFMLGHNHQDTVDRRFLQMIKSSPPEYRSGIGEAGMKAIADFVAGGGRLVALDAACALAITACDLMVEDVTASKSTREYFCKGSTLRVGVDTMDPLGYGMKSEAWVVNWNSSAFSITDQLRPHDYAVVARYPQTPLLKSGWLIGEPLLQGKAAVLRVCQGDGDIALLGCRVQHRAQTHGTFKLLFNALYR